MSHPPTRLLLLVAVLVLTATAARGEENLTPPAPVRLAVHSTVLNEDRPVWVAFPEATPTGKPRIRLLT